ncbi:MAG: ABC-2 family transporter protein [Candidatus Sericytochromatia bacterium]|nr:ABC-2 family transporter protein [Candidatus Sericytochromatia bacterium]
MPLLRRYALIYREYVNNCVAEALSYRLHFVLLIVMDLLFYLSLLGGVDFLFQHLDQIGPWNRQAFLFFMAFMIAVEHLHMTFVSENFWAFSHDIRTGKLDFILLKPAAALFIVFFRAMRPATLLLGLFPWGLLGWYGSQLGLLWWQWLLLPPLVLLGLALLTSVEILISMSMFWLVESMGINFLRMQLQQLSRWPDFIYGYFAQKFFGLAVPVLLVGSAPVRFVLNPHDTSGLLWLLGLMGLSWLLTAFFWRRGLRAYESASS